MHGLTAILKKELADHFSSYRFAILFALIAMVSLITAYMVGIKIRGAEDQVKPQFVFLMVFTERGTMFSLGEFVAFFGPLVGLILGFDTINRERNEGTLSKLLARPIYRDVVINGKFLAGVFLIAVMLLSIVLVITGLGLILIGIVPGAEEIGRMLIYLVISVVYAGLEKALDNTNILQDAVIRLSRPGKAAADVFDEAMAEMKAKGIAAQVYSHPLGPQGHGLGASIDFRSAKREPDAPLKKLRLGSYLALELNTASEVPEWGGQKVTMMAEDPVYLTENGWAFFRPRQGALYLIK